jgi:hypothetical protein
VLLRRPRVRRMATSLHRCLRAASTIAALLFAVCSTTAQQPAASGKSAPVSDFNTRIGQYMKLRSTAPAATNRKSSGSSDKLVQERQAITDRILEARPHAKQGDIFAPSIASYFRQQIAATLSGADGRRIRTSFRHAEPVRGRLQVNQHYPGRVPLQSMPPSLLMNLPQLPKDLEYRFVGRDLVLRDVGANLIVDFIPNALPRS